MMMGFWNIYNVHLPVISISSLVIRVYCFRGLLCLTNPGYHPNYNRHPESGADERILSYGAHLCMSDSISLFLSSADWC